MNREKVKSFVSRNIMSLILVFLLGAALFGTHVLLSNYSRDINEQLEKIGQQEIAIPDYSARPQTLGSADAQPPDDDEECSGGVVAYSKNRKAGKTALASQAPRAVLPQRTPSPAPQPQTPPPSPPQPPAPDPDPDPEPDPIICIVGIICV